jgi:prepilin-type N-terminal cleavage/methylation domain-containing protein
MKLRQKQAFGLIEILVVLVIIAILASILLPRYLSGGKDPRTGKKTLAPREKAQQVGGIAYLSQIQQAITMYKMDNEDKLPQSLTELGRYGVTGEMLIDPVSKQPLGYNPQTGEVTSPTELPGNVGRAMNQLNNNK